MILQELENKKLEVIFEKDSIILRAYGTSDELPYGKFCHAVTDERKTLREAIQELSGFVLSCCVPHLNSSRFIDEAKSLKIDEKVILRVLKDSQSIEPMKVVRHEIIDDDHLRKITESCFSEPVSARETHLFLEALLISPIHNLDDSFFLIRSMNDLEDLPF